MKYVKKLRIEKGFSEQHLAKLIGISAQSLRNYENGISIKTNNRVAILSYFKINHAKAMEYVSEDGFKIFEDTLSRKRYKKIKLEVEKMNEKVCLNQACPLNKNKCCQSFHICNKGASCEGQNKVTDKAKKDGGRKRIEI